MALNQVTCSANKIIEIILNEYPEYYNRTKMTKMLLIAEFVKPIHHELVYELMETKRREEINSIKENSENL